MPPVFRSLPAERRCWTLCAACALLLGVATDLGPHRVWGFTTTVGYAAAALAAGRSRRSGRVLPAASAVAGAVLVPLVALVAVGRAQPEVAVVERSARLLLRTGSPYVANAAGVADHNPYLPGMSLLGLPSALLGHGPVTDARWYFATVFAVAVVAALRTARRTASTAVLLVSACPLVALPLATGGIDLPIAGLICLGLALAGRGNGGRAGLVLGVAAALKWTAWPALPVALALLSVRNGRRPALRCAGGWLAVLAALVLPVAVTDPAGLGVNAVAFPLGLTDAVSPAASPLPGHLLATHLPGGRLVAIAALATAAGCVAVSLVVAPPLSTRAAADRLAIGLGLASCLLPATRFGYLLIPFVLLAWLRCARPAATPRKVPARAPYAHRHQ
ncbi:glycosyltransferase 87 family protein [Streptomyces olivaceiscleroticus]|uniref:Glycosyltransferase 87 family protein n=1 Tax=Streptomyces olivaceiscleroticus TaxID=68245 RepID=A0ABP3JW06_9ACTN